VARLKAAVAGAVDGSSGTVSAGPPQLAATADTGDAEGASTDPSADECSSEDEAVNLLAHPLPPPAKRLRGLPPKEAMAQNLWEVALCVPRYAYSARHDVALAPAIAAAASSSAASTAPQAGASSAEELAGAPDGPVCVP
jgi:hypothetical protein